MTGVVTLSIELELGWGMHDKPEYGHLSENRVKESDILNRLLDLGDSKELPITFAIVGHLFHDSCQGHHPSPHPDSWWAEDPGTDRSLNPYYYSPDLVEEIRERVVKHEIGTHTYSHLLAEEASGEQLTYELSKVENIYSDFGIPSPSSIVMPRHQVPDYSILSDFGIDTIRCPMEVDSSSRSDPFSKFWSMITREHPVSNLQRSDGILETTVTPYPSLTSGMLPSGQSKPHPAFSLIPRRTRRNFHKQYLIDAIDRAADEGAHVHLWTHIFNMANEDQWSPIKAGLSHLATQRDKGNVKVNRMKDL